MNDSHLRSVATVRMSPEQTTPRSYPNFIPLSQKEVEHIGAAMAPFKFDVLYGHYFDRVIAKDAKAVLEKSIVRYIAAINGTRGY